ncbi:hypothetical protein BT93_L1260 [Corymbia citriodora subsp. variegata]|uniref:Kinetochore-associated protein MTW1 n=1 Tax=Corymbia citriodora subsp. variegata TaxID=360336 RepID=A0A8T0CEB6_CORYI|nr:hypothetical protein BT93_L1260 [Corymbia citriodora subsp. variegata]
MEIDDSAAATALLAEHLEYTPLSLIDDIIDSVNNIIYQGVNSLEIGLNSTAPDRLGFESGDEQIDRARLEIEEGLHKLETLLNSTVDKNFDKFEIYVLRNILSIPAGVTPYVRLSHYEGLKLSIASDVPSPEQLTLLRKKLFASRVVNRRLKSEVDKNNTMISQLKSMLQSEHGQAPGLAFLQPGNNTAQHQLTTNAKFALSQLPALKSAINDVRSKAQSLGSSADYLGTVKDEAREGRRGYIEERTKGVLTRHGIVTQPDMLHDGTRFTKDDLEALEQTAAMFNPP